MAVPHLGKIDASSLISLSIVWARPRALAMILCNLFSIYFDFLHPISKSNEYPDLWRRKILAVRVSKFSRQSRTPDNA
jgi:hypothetical protein